MAKMCENCHSNKAQAMYLATALCSNCYRLAVLEDDPGTPSHYDYEAEMVERPVTDD